MDKALFLNDDKVKVEVFAKDLTKAKYNEKYRGRLYCENPDCNAEIVFKPIQKGNKHSHFCTKNKSVHVKNCVHEIIHKGIKGPTITIDTGESSVSDEHVQKSLNDLYKKFWAQIHPTDSDTTKRKKRRKRRKKISFQR